jgi:outer membrane protein assembly factor BamB
MVGKFVVAGSAAGDLKFINPDNGLIERTVPISVAHSPVKTSEFLYVGTLAGEVVKMDLDGKILERIMLSQNGVSSVAIWKEGLVAATHDGKLHFLNKNNLNIEEIFLLGSRISTVFGSLAVSEDKLAVYSSRNRLYIFQ